MLAIVVGVLFYAQSCFAMQMLIGRDLKQQNLAPAAQVNMDSFKQYFREDIAFKNVAAESINRFVKMTDDLKEDKDLLYLFNKINKLGQLDEKDTILSLLVMTNGVRMPVIRLLGGLSAIFIVN